MGVESRRAKEGGETELRGLGDVGGVVLGVRWYGYFDLRGDLGVVGWNCLIVEVACRNFGELEMRASVGGFSISPAVVLDNTDLREREG